MNADAKSLLLKERPTDPFAKLTFQTVRWLLAVSVVVFIVQLFATHESKFAEWFRSAFPNDAIYILTGLAILGAAFGVILDKPDQLVWLNASHEDRIEILQKRSSKNAKNQ